jgi:glutaredoxin 3
MDPKLRNEMMEKSGRSTFPQIFIDGKHIGGCDDLMALDRAGKLDAMLQA